MKIGFSEALANTGANRATCGANKRLGFVASGRCQLHGEFGADELDLILIEIRKEQTEFEAASFCASTRKVGPIFRGQHWVSLHGEFKLEELSLILVDLNCQCQGLERPKTNTV